MQASTAMGAGRVPGPLGSNNGGQLVIAPGPLGDNATGTQPNYQEFKQAVFDKQVANKRAKGATCYPSSVSDSELAVVEGKFRMRKEAAQSCRALLAAARADLASGAASGDSRALHVKSIAIRSAYRNYAEDLLAWESAYRTHYDQTELTREAAAGGAHGREAMRILVKRMEKYKAAPGFSNHSNGSAVDFETTQSGILYAAKSAQRVGWRGTWLHAWLVQNAATFRFMPLATEEWHWDYK
jgi:hypothetical protein